MVLMTGLDSVIESLYLREDLSTKIKDSDIVVNPMSTYIAKKVVIINKKYYPSTYIDELLSNDNTLVSRFPTYDSRIHFDPYELRMNDSIRCLGSNIDLVTENLYEEINHLFDNGILYYPKPLIFYDYMNNGYLTVLGYLLYQLGCKLEVSTRYTELDIIKSRTGLIL